MHQLESKSSKRLVIHGTEHVIHKNICNQEVTVNDCLSIPLQINYHNYDKVSELVTVVRNNGSPVTVVASRGDGVLD